MAELIPAQATDEIILPDMTKAEAEETDRLIRQTEAMKRIRVYLMWKRKGWKALKYPTFEAYCEERIDTSRQVAYNWIQQVEVSLSTGFFSLSNLSTMLTNEKETPKLLAQTVTQEFTKLKDNPANMKLAYSEYKAVSEHNHSETALTAVKRIVKRFLGQKTAKEIEHEAKRPDALETAMRAKQEPSASKPAEPVKSFTPYTPFAAAPLTLDFLEAVSDLELARSWVKEEQVAPGTAREIVLRVMASLDEAARWVERQLEGAAID